MAHISRKISTKSLNVQTVPSDDLSATLVALKDEAKRLQGEVKAKSAVVNIFKGEDKIIAKNPQYVPCSLRLATDADKKALGVHCHGVVGDIKCLKCGTLRVCNKQDLFQSKFCKEHVKEAKKEAQKAKRAAKANSPAVLKAKIEAAKKKLAALNTKKTA
jgi:hypothetical protein